jgi:hypothetical protein
MRTCNRCHSFRPYGSVVTVDAIYGNKNEADLEGAALARLVSYLVDGGPATKCERPHRPLYALFCQADYFMMSSLVRNVPLFTCSILPLTDQCLALCRSVPPVLRLELQKMPAVLHHPIVVDPAFRL